MDSKRSRSQAAKGSQGGRDEESGRGNIMYTRLEDRATGTKRVSRSVAVRGET